ncbi:cytochrome P450 [Crossiella equi]|uniref:Cytochrome P450 n=1 Tax=Crossiella equi TaxID=130796 RepID=A0ABS5ANX3_9PSEU|nr:cytochrome P450 [Crossiella equi]MBP2478261.1 cytochrome P450 [Crossiella equi]
MTQARTSTTDLEPVAYPFNTAEGLELSDRYQEVLTAPGLLRVQMRYGEPAWLATRYADARFVLGDKRFSRAMEAERDSPRQWEGERSGGILQMDPPDHTRLRTLVTKAFTVRRVEALRPGVAALADSLLDDLIAKGAPADLVEDYALPIPVAVICELLGVPALDRPKFRVWSDNALSTSGLTPEEFQRSQDEMRDYMAGLVAEHRAHPQDDLMTALIEARDVDDRLTELELIDLCVGILVAGHETTATQIPNFVWLLLEHPEQLKLLRDKPELIPNAVEELLRFVPLGVGASFPRYATEDVHVGEVLVKAGEPVLVSVGAANRDALKFTNPGVLDVERVTTGHLGFGHGVHHCLGAQLARMELQEGLRALLAKMPGLHLTGDVVWKTQMIVRGPKSMPIGW